MAKKNRSIVSASVLAAFVLTAPTVSQATPTSTLQAAPARQEKLVSKAAVEAIVIKAQSTDMQMRTGAFVQENGPSFVQWRAQSKPPKPPTTRPTRIPTQGF